MKDGRSSIIIDRLISMVENGQSVTFSSGKVAINKDETIMLLKELGSIVSGELKVYREVNDRKGRIIAEAKKEAEEIVYEAEKSASRIRVTKRISNYGNGFRPEELDDEEKKALRTAHDIYAASVIYTDEMLTEVTDVVAEAYDIINNQYGRMVNVLEEKAKMIADNKAELMAGLRELSKEERYSQIMELSQLLSNELYSEKVRRNQMEEYAMAQYEEIMNSDSAFADTDLYDSNSDSAFGENVAAYDSAFGENVAADSAFGENITAVDSAFGENITAVDSAFADNSVSESATTDDSIDSMTDTHEELTNPFDELNAENNQINMSPVEEKILEQGNSKDVDEDGVKLLHPVNQFDNKKDPIANTLMMFNRERKNRETGK